MESVVLSNSKSLILPCMDVNHMVLLSDEWIMRCCVAVDYWATVAVLRCTLVAMVIWGLGTVTALVNAVCSCCGCNYRSRKDIHVNHIISLNDWWVRQLGASEWCSNPILGLSSIKGALPWWDTVICDARWAGKDNRVHEEWMSWF